MNQFGVRGKYSKRIAVIAPSADDGMTQQHFKDQVDINNILAKYRRTGVVEHVKKARELYGDFTELGEYARDLDKVAKAQQTFEMMPAEIRNQFKNSIQGFFEFIGDEKNKDQCVKWGIFDAPKEAAGMPAGSPEPGVVPGSKKDGSPKKTKVVDAPTDQE